MSGQSLILRNPSRTVAILVGIERYKDSGWGDLHGPAMDALRFANWLNEQGVDKKNLHFHLSLGEITDAGLKAERDALLASLTTPGTNGAPSYGGAKRADLEAATDPEYLQTLMPEDGEATLILYFSGHGLCSESTFRRYIIAQDATSDSMNVVNLMAMTANLRVHRCMRQYTTQWLIVDACAQDIGAWKLRELNVQPPDNTAERAAQFWLFATQPGEFGYTSGERQAGVFTDALLTILQQRTLDGLDLEAVFTQLERMFANERQRPSVTRRDQDGGERSIAVVVKKVKESLEQLVALLQGLVGVHMDVLRRVFCEVTNAVDGAPASFEELVYRLDAYAPIEGAGLSNAEIFAIRLKHRFDHWSSLGAPLSAAYAQASVQLQKWIDKYPGTTAAPSVTEETSRLRDESPNAGDVPTVVVQIDDTAQDNDVRCWLYRGNTVEAAERVETTGATLQEQLTHALGTVGALGWLTGEDTIVELVLPLSIMFNGYACLTISINSPPIRYQLGVRPALLALRVSERWTRKEWQRGWQTRWKKYQAMLGATPKLEWLATPTAPAVSPTTWLGVHGNLKPDWIPFLSAQLFQGALFVVWCDSANQAGISQGFRQNAGKPHLALLQSLSQFNTADATLTCLIDEPERVPPGAGLQSALLQQPPTEHKT
ncbi:caspase family protein [Paraburkholderia caribensis]|uniref:Caspase family protein n=1 Tax=Paraburkholderia caribensis TaxID=75105 RepID=A0A9Q6WNX7_9BURK|nr:caspase family protein [Paraburkholderia caribensis]MCO4882977.1 caspase family protein [Paraburkholderia caribensis]PTB30679.1 hypothetical protein C9I56_00195 [Paraburkholderia caribensis]QLB65582.1 hypothetical protein A9O66_24720 [Paraburkholderia caribensis]